MNPQPIRRSIILWILTLTLYSCGKWNTDNPMIPVGPTLAVKSSITFPGWVMAMAVKENLLYVCALPQSPDSTTKLFYVVDASDPSNPAIVGSALEYGQFGQISYGLALHDSFAYVYTQREGLVTLDISDPATPRVAATNDTLYAIPAAVSGSHLFALGYGLCYLSLADPIHPRLEGKSNLDPLYPRDLAPWDETRSVLYDDRTDQVVIEDFSVPSAPKTVAYSPTTTLSGLAVCSGNIFGITRSSSPAVLKFSWDGGDSVFQKGKTDLPGGGECLTDAQGRIVVGVKATPDLYVLSTFGANSPYVVAEGHIPWLPYSIVAAANRIYVNVGYDIYFVEVNEP